MKCFFSIPIVVSCAVIATPLFAERPDFQAPFSCGQNWQLTTYDIPDDPATADDESLRHGPFAVDGTQRDGTGDQIGNRQPIVASAAGRVVLDYTWPGGDKEGERWIFVDHADGWRTQYVHLHAEPGKPRLAVGRRIAMGEVLGFNSNSGTGGVHLHYAQRREVGRDAESLANRAAAGAWGTVLSDGEERRVRFDGTLVQTYRSNTAVVNTGSGAVPEDIWSRNCPGSQFVQWFDNGRNMMLRYNPANGDMRINEIHPTGGDNPLRHSETWARTWNTIVPFYSPVNRQAHVFRYNFATGDTEFHRISIGGTGLTQTGSVRKYSGWTGIVPLAIDGKPHAIFYDSRYGWFNVDEINVTATGFVSRLKTRIQTGYTHLLPFEEGPRRYVLMYKGGSGRMAIQKLTRQPNGSVTREVVWSAKRRAGWTHLSLLKHRGSLHVLGYDSVKGDARLWRIKRNEGGLEGTASLNWGQPGWTSFTPYHAGGRAHVLLYRASDGKSRKIRMIEDATGFRHQITETWARGYR